MRPASIVQFERLYLAALAASVLSEVLNFSLSAAALRASGVGPEVLLATDLLLLAVAVALWFLAARRRSVMAKWLVAIWFVLSSCSLAYVVVRGWFHFDAIGLLGLLAYLLRAWSVSYLFKPDADEWFASRQ